MMGIMLVIVCMSGSGFLMSSYLWKGMLSGRQDQIDIIIYSTQNFISLLDFSKFSIIVGLQTMNKRTHNNNISYSAIATTNQQSLSNAVRRAFPSYSGHRSLISTTSHHKKKIKYAQKSFSDSQSSEVSCLQKKFYRCGCGNSNKGVCGHPYQNYLAQQREKRLQKKASLLLKQKQNKDQLLYFEGRQTIGSIPVFSASSSRLLGILEQSEQAEYSKSKPDYSISISVGRHLYFRKLKSKQQFLACITEIQRTIARKA